MIITTLITLFMTLLRTVLSWLPTAQVLPDSFNNAWTWLSGWVSTLFYVIPTGENLLAIFTIMIIVIGSAFAFKFIKLMYNAIRGSGA